jgi:signal transduction histidine kinase
MVDEGKTEAQQAEEKIHRLASFPQMNPQPILEIDIDGRITFYNQAALEVLGEMGKAADLSKFLPDDLQEILAKAKQTGERDFQREVVVNGVVFFESIYFAEQFNALHLHAVDITERKRAEAALRESEEHYHSLFDNMLEGFAYCRMHFEQNQPVDFTYLNVNGAFETLTGLKNVIGKKVSEVIPGIRESNPKLFETYGRVASTGIPERLETYVEPLGMWFSISVYSPKKEHFVAVFDVITERKLAEKALRERTAELELANREMESFSYSVSHDLKTPVRAIQGFSRMLLGEHAAQLDAEGLRLLQVVCDNTKRMDHLIDDLLALSRVGRLQIRKSVIDMTAMVRRIFNQLRAQMSERDLGLTVGDLPPAWGDQSLLHQVMMNLLANAVKFTRSRETAVIEVGGRTEGKEDIYYVKDNGAGFDERYADKLFGVFQRLHGGEEYEGTGVGLSIVKRIVQRHGGRVWAEGKVGEGATFYFALPKNGA